MGHPINGGLEFGGEGKGEGAKKPLSIPLILAFSPQRCVLRNR